MAQLGSGLEYKVYDEGDARVLKVRRSLPNRLFASFRYAVRARSFTHSLGIARILMPKINGVPGLLASLANESRETKRWFANIESAGGNDYTQDRILPLRDYFVTHSLEENIAIAERYVGLIRSMWTVGVGDPYYNFQFNAGVYPDGSVAQMDVADLVTDGEFLASTVQRQVWLETGIPGVADEELREACIRLFDAGFTAQSFAEGWAGARR